MTPHVTLRARRLHATSLFVGIQVLPEASKAAEVAAVTAVAAAEGHHMILLLDTSGSMEGDRLEAVQRTLRIFVQHLKVEDRLTLIEWNSTAKVLCQACSDHAMLNTCIDGLQANGGTNLEAALLQLSAFRETPVDAIFLLTDGHINQGQRSVATLGHLLQASLGSHAATAPLMALGFGEDHNADMLQAFAIQTRGTYTFADGDSKEMIPAILGNLLGELEARVGLRASVSWEGPTADTIAGVQCLELGAAPNATSYWMGNLIADKPQWVVCHMPADITGVCLTWTDPQTNEVHTCRVALEATNQTDPDVLEQTHRVEVVRTLQSVKHRAHPMRVLPKLTALEQTLQTSAVASRPLVLQLLAEVKAAIQNVDSQGPVRQTSNMTTLGMQRGLLSLPLSQPLSLPLSQPLHDPLATLVMPDAHTLFSSPSQNRRRHEMVSGFSQTQIETPFHFPS